MDATDTELERLRRRIASGEAQADHLATKVLAATNRTMAASLPHLSAVLRQMAAKVDHLQRIQRHIGILQGAFEGAVRRACGSAIPWNEP